MTTGKTKALIRWTFVGKVMSLLFNMLSRLVITFFPSSKHLLISWLQPQHSKDHMINPQQRVVLCAHTLSHVWLFATLQTLPARLLCPWDSPGKHTEWVAISFSHAWKRKVKVKSLSRIQLLATPWAAAYQDPLSIGFSRQEYWSGVPSPSLFLAATKSAWKGIPW